MRKIWIILFCFSTQYNYGQIVIPGVEYEHVAAPSLSIHYLMVDPQKARIVLEPAQSYYGNAETTSSIAQRNRAVAAVNGGFFDFGQKNTIMYTLIKLLELVGIYPYYAFPVFCLKVKDAWLSLSNIKGALLGWSEDGQKVALDAVQTSWTISIDNKQYPIKNMNKRYAKGPTLYTPAYGLTTPLKSKVTEVVIEHTTVTKIIQGQGNTPIPRAGYVYALEDTSVPFKTGVPVSIEKKFTGSNCTYEWHTMDYLLGSTPLLLKNGVIVQSLYKKKTPFYVERHPRTAVGLLSNGQWLFVVVDGYQSSSRGSSLLELAQLLKDRGCVTALNLDGDNSSTMVIHNKIVNSPSSEYGLTYGKYGERPVANALLIMPRA